MIRSNAISVDNDLLTQGQVIALYNYLSQILVELIKFANLIITTSKGIAASKRISAILNIEDSDEDVNSDILPENGSVRFNNVSLQYFGSSASTLKNINIDIPSGTKVGVIGGTGSGKTSLVNMIPGFYKATEGDVFVGNHNVKEISRKNLRDAVGIVPQHAQVFSGTIRDNILRGNENATEEDIIDSLKFASAYDIVTKKGGLDAVLSEGGSDLSGGQKQRLTIARAAVKKPKILILDDSASALDFATEKDLRNQINKLTDTTAFIVSQRISSVMHLDKIVVMDNGQICGYGTHDELLSTCPIYKEIYESQIEKGASA
jgi:ABC-type multidrug transport system fused ATPase/permease subunit